MLKEVIINLDKITSFEKHNAFYFPMIENTKISMFGMDELTMKIFKKHLCKNIENLND